MIFAFAAISNFEIKITSNNFEPQYQTLCGSSMCVELIDSAYLIFPENSSITKVFK